MIELSAITPFTWQVGAALLVAQVVLTTLLEHASPPGPWKDQPGLTAHQIITLPLMIYLTYHGFCAVIIDDRDSFEGWQGRLFGILPRGQDMASIVFGSKCSTYSYSHLYARNHLIVPSTWENISNNIIFSGIIRWTLF